MGNGSATFLVSGASGMIGQALLAALAIRNSSALQLVRSRPVSESQIQWDPATSIAVQGDELENLAAVIHLSGAGVADHRWTRSYKREITQSRVQSTRVLSETLAQLRNPPKALLVASATGIYGDRGDELLDETSSPGAGFLAEVCQQWEAAAAPAVGAGIRVVHLRFGVVLGPGKGALSKMMPVFRLGLGGRLGTGRQWMSWISLTDVVSAILFAAERPVVAGAVNLTAPHAVTNSEFTRALGRALHRPAILPVPALALRIALGQMADEALLASARVIPAVLTAAGFSFTQPTIDEALAAIVGQGGRAAQ